MEPKTGTTRRTTTATATASSPTAGSPTQAGTTGETPSGEPTQGWINRRASAQATRAANARQVSGRRRFVDPTTCERDYSVAEMEFMQAIHDYKQRSGRMFPTWSEVLEVLKSLGYAKSDESDIEPTAAPALLAAAVSPAAPVGRAVPSARAV